MNCPVCGYPQYCGCSACEKRDPRPFGFYRQVMFDLPNGISVAACPNCAHVLSLDEWQNLDEDQFKETFEILLRLPEHYKTAEFVNFVEKLRKYI